MFEGVVANLLNKYLGRYIQNLDTDNLSIGIYSGSVELTDLQLKPEALFELDLPVEVKAGYVGKISATIPWTSLYSSPVKVNVEDVYVLAGPVSDRSYDAKKEAALNMAIKRSKLAEIEKLQSADEDDPTAEDQGFVEKLTATIINNIQVSIQRIHIRYEDRITNPDNPCSCGIMLKHLSAETTNAQWQPSHVEDTTASQIHKLVQLKSLSLYWNPDLPEESMVRNQLNSTDWRNSLRNALETHKILKDKLEFIMQPLSAEAKLVFNKDGSTNLPHMVADFVLDDFGVAVSRHQFLNILSISDSFKLMAVNQLYRKFAPGVPLHGNVRKWWRYAYNAIVEERIRPYSWERIKTHRQSYKRYINVYKKKLEFPEDANIRKQLEPLEEKLDVSNIVMARTQAKMEFEKESPDRLKQKPPAKPGVWDWIWGSSSGAAEVDDMVIANSKAERSWLRQLSVEEKKSLYEAIGYDSSQKTEQSAEYVAHKVNISLLNCSISLKNYEKEVLKILVSHLTGALENRPNSNGFKFAPRTESFVIEGLSGEERAPLITSDIGDKESPTSQVFSMEFEVNPLYVEADLGLKLNVQPVKVVYDEQAVTEVIAFFQVPEVTLEDVRGAVAAGWGQVVDYSRMSLQYAIEQHKTIHVEVNMRSPYLVIPEHGTLDRGGNVIVVDFGTLTVESELQPKDMSLHECSMSEIETRLYDKFNINITDVKALLADTDADWHTAQALADSEYHILPSVGMQLAFFNTVKADYKQLPQHKLEATLSVLKLKLSDEKIQKIAEFFKNIPVPQSSSVMEQLTDEVDGGPPSAGNTDTRFYAKVLSKDPSLMVVLSATRWLRKVRQPQYEPLELDVRSVQKEPTVLDLRRMRRSVRMNSVVEKLPEPEPLPEPVALTSLSRVSSRSSWMSADSELFYSASDHSDEDIEEWSRGLTLPKLDDHCPSNQIAIRLHFSLREVIVEVNKARGKTDIMYLVLRVEKLRVEAAKTTHGLAMNALLGSVEVVDKLHPSGTPGKDNLEMIYSNDDRDLITVLYRNVSPDCPDFESKYKSVEQGLVINFSSLNIVFDRAASLYLNQFIQDIMFSITSQWESEENKKPVEKPAPVTPQPASEEMSFPQSIFRQASRDLSTIGVTKLHLVANLDNLEVQMVNHELKFAEIVVRGLEAKVIAKTTRTIIQARLNKMLIEDLTESTFYPRILTIEEDDDVFDFKLTTHHKVSGKFNLDHESSEDCSLRLRVGRVSGVYLYKFISEITAFVEPFISPQTYENYKKAAQSVVQDTTHGGDDVDGLSSAPKPRNPVTRSQTSAASIGPRARRQGVIHGPRLNNRRQTAWEASPEAPPQLRKPSVRRNFRRQSVMDKAFHQLPAIIENIEKPGSELRRTGEAVNQGFVQLRKKSVKVQKGVQQLQRKSMVAQEAFSEIKKTGTRLRRKISIRDRMSNVFDRFKSSSLQAIQQGIQDVQEQGTRISLHVDIKAPTIQVPQHSRSRNLLLLKLGDLKLSNSFDTSLEEGAEVQNWDILDLRLDSVQVIRGVSMNGQIEEIHTMVQPISFILEIKRALPPMHTNLALDISGKLHIVKMCATEQDLKVLMCVLRENYKETSLYLEKVDAEDLQPIVPEPASPVTAELPGRGMHTETVIVIEPPAEDTQANQQQTRFNVTLEGLRLTLLGQENTEGEAHSDQGKLEDLSRFEIGCIYVDGLLKSDSSLEVTVKLQSISMDDTRAHSNLAVKTLLSSSLPPTGKVRISRTEKKPMVVVEYGLSPEGNQHMNLHMETVRINVCMPYLLMIWHFFMDSMFAPTDDSLEPLIPPVVAPTVGQPVSPSGGEEVSKPVQNTFKIHGTFKQPELVLFAEPTEKHSRVLLLKTNAEFKYSSCGESDEMDAEVKQVQIISCLYGSTQSASMVLHPCDLKFSRVTDATTGGMKMKAHSTDIFMNLSATSLNVIHNVIDVISHDGQLTESVDGDVPPPVHDHLWETISIKPDKWVLPEEEDPNKSKYPLLPAAPPSETLDMEMKKVQILFEVENQDYGVPRLCIKSGIKASLHDWSTQMRCSAELKLEVSYFNEKLANWEPLLEPVMVAEDNYQPWEVLIKMADAYGKPVASGDSEGMLDSEKEIEGSVHHMMSKAKSEKENWIAGEVEVEEAEVVSRKNRRLTRMSSNKSYESEMDEVDGGEVEEGTPVELCHYVVIDSRDELNINVTPQALDVINEVVEAFTRTNTMSLKSVQDLPGFEMHNELEMMAKLTVHQDVRIHEESLHNIINVSKNKRTPSTVASCASDEMDELDGLSHLAEGLGAFGPMLMSIGAFAFDDQVDDAQSRKILTKDKIHVKIDGFDELYGLSLKKAATKLVPLTPTKNENKYHVVYNVEMEHGRKVVTVRSPLQVHNNLTVAMEIYCLTEDLSRYGSHSPVAKTSESYTLLKELEPDHTYHVPLFVAYHCKLRLAPAQPGYDKTAGSLWWQEMEVSEEKSRHFVCQSSDSSNKPFYFKVLAEEGRGQKGPEHAKTPIPHYVFQIHPTVVIHNLLPYDIDFSLQGCASNSLKHGENAPIYRTDFNTFINLKIQLNDYLDVNWSGAVELCSTLDEVEDVVMETDANIAGQNKQLSLGLHISHNSSMDVYIYSPYWVINKTDLPLQIRGGRSEIVYENGKSASTLLFTYQKHKRKKAKLKVHNAKWTPGFSMDTVASNGVVVCTDKENNRKYQFLVEITLSRLKLTKMVTIMPYFLVVNNSSHRLQYKEKREESNTWFDIIPEQITPYWPETESMQIYVRYEDSQVSSQPFSLKDIHSTVLRMEGGTALVVEVAGGMETPITITFLSYEEGAAPVRIDNLCKDISLKFQQKNESQVSLLAPLQSVLYTWDDPTTERTLQWNVFNSKKPSFTAEITMDAVGEEEISKEIVRHSSVLAPNLQGRNTGQEKHELDTLKECTEDDDSDSDLIDQTAPLLGSTSMLANGKDDMLTSGYHSDTVCVYWVSFLDGLQRVLLFTQDQQVAQRACAANEAEKSTMAVFMSLSGVSMSIVNALQEEVAFITLSSAPAMWEVEQRSRWKTLPLELAAWLEEKWRRNDDHAVLEDYMEKRENSQLKRAREGEEMEVEPNPAETKKLLKNSKKKSFRRLTRRQAIKYRKKERCIEANLDLMEMRKPFTGGLRRNYHPALWVQYRYSAHHTYLHTRIHRLQIDNQLPDAYFQTVLHPTPIPSYIIDKAGPKPFIEMAVLRRQVPESNIDSIKYCKVLMQEFSIKLDKGFMLSVYDIYASRLATDEESSQLEQDLNIVNRTLRGLTDVTTASREQRIVFENLHLSPLKMHISFSLEGTVHEVAPQASSLPSDIVQFFLQSVGATLSEIKDVELRMAYFERKGAVLSWTQLMAEVQHHYVSQGMRQAYVILLGLDVLGNPYGLMKDLSQGLGDFFYEPFLGTIHSPDQFTDNLVKGIRSLLGHTVGGLAGSVSLVTGSLGRALASLSFDKDYKRKRHQRMLQKPRHLPASLYVAGKGFVMGVAVGLSGVVVSPVRGAQEEGVEGFFKGIGKGLLGLVTKPTGGAVDMVSMTFDGIRRAAEMGADVVVRMRPPRFIHPDRGLKPYSMYQAVGMRMLYSLAKGHYADTDVYLAHAPLNKEDKRADVVLVTDKRVMLLEKQRFWGDWDVEWEVELEELHGPPILHHGKLILKVKKDDAEFSLYISDEREILCAEQDVIEWLGQKVEQARLAMYTD